MISFPGIYIVEYKNEEDKDEYRVGIIEKFEDLYDNTEDFINENIKTDVIERKWINNESFCDYEDALNESKRLEEEHNVEFVCNVPCYKKVFSTVYAS